MSNRVFGKDCEVIWKDKKHYWGLPISLTRYSIVRKPNQWIKLFVETGFFNTHIEEVHLFRITDFSVYETFSNKLLGVGNVDIFASDKKLSNFSLTRIKNPYKVYELLSECVEKDRKSRNVGMTELQR